MWATGHTGQMLQASNICGLPQPWGRMPTTAWQEWLLPFAPVSLLWVGALIRRPLRAPAVCLALLLLGYLCLTNAVMGYFEPLGPQSQERGSFLLGLALPAVALGTLWLPTPACLLALACALAVAVVDVRRNDWQPVPPDWADGVRAVLAEGPCELWLGDMDRDFGWVEKLAEDVPRFSVAEIPRDLALHEAQGRTVDAAMVAALFDRLHDDAVRAGRRHLLSAQALAWLQKAPDPRIRALQEEHLPRCYAMTEAGHGVFRAFLLTRR
jgi:hypothetical protein